MQNIKTIVDIGRSRVPSIMALVLSLLALVVATISVSFKNIYQDVLLAGTMSERLVNGSLAQDIITIPLAFLLSVLTLLYLKKRKEKIFITIIGLTSYFSYAYGIYAIEGIYTIVYPFYLLILGLSIYSLIFAFSCFKIEQVKKSFLPKKLRISIALFLLLIVFVLGPGWLLRMMPNVLKHVPEDTYSVFVLDLCIVFPAFIITFVKLLKNKPFANILAGVMLVKVFTVCLSWGFGEWYVIFEGKSVNYSLAFISSILTLISVILFTRYIAELELNKSN